MLILAALLAVGIVCGDALTPSEAARVAALSLAILIPARRAPSPSALAAIAAAGFGLGASAAAWERAAYERTPLRAWVSARAEPRLARLVGVAAMDGVMRDGQQMLVLDVQHAAVDGQEVDLRGRARIRVAGETEHPTIEAGDRVTVWAEMRAPRGYANPGALDVEALARQDGLHATGQAKSARLVSVAPCDTRSWADLPMTARRHARAALLRHVPEGPARGIVLAMTLGDQSLVDDATAERFRVAGTYHVLALSGAQVALMAGGLVLILRRLRIGPLGQAAWLTPVLIFYAALVGGETPIVRATVMALAALWGRAWDMDVDLANLLGFTAAALLLWHPSAVGDVGFALSFAATLGILLLVPVLLAVLPALPLRLEVSIAGSLASQAALVPILATRFHRLAPAAVLLNLIAVPLSGLVLLAGLLTLACAFIGGALAHIAGQAAWIAADLLIRSCDLVAPFPSLDMRTPGGAPFALFVYAGGLLGLLASTRHRGRATALLLLGLFGLQFPAPPADGRLHLTVLDVGQGDALVLRTPAGRVWMVDAGGTATGFDVGENVVAPYLWSLPVTRLEGLLVTHAHVDHVGGAPFLLRHFEPRDLLEGPAPTQDAAYRRFDDAAAHAAARRRTVTRGVSLVLDGVRLDVVGPAPPERLSTRTRNDDSVVLRVTFGNVSLLLPGDVERAGEETLRGFGVDVLKVPHHGSRTSSGDELLRRLGPRVAVLSVGARNHFGHPHPEVLRRYTGRGIPVYRTDRDGAVTLSTDGRRVWVSAFGSGAGAVVRP